MIIREERMPFLLTIPLLGYLVVVIHSFIHPQLSDDSGFPMDEAIVSAAGLT
jgi:hypothetical protein